ncbi:hypothetical protein [Microbacterium sp. VKM Ac-2923]|uniref:hypothetical protein n=1 Tax=Microbacterium sp. VKM Ac-2923 TaxID=2929476 RepID=UPI001FB29A69|nr:hypothetical protein [Microbacterium sp. VKM Ac-2923]MCJ1706178.1 hypothetical protein [Microbacterium sp. VKM Ac-2923]
MRRAAVLAAVVLAHAAVQALCVVPGLTPAASPAFLGLVGASVAALVAASTVVLVRAGEPGEESVRRRAARAVAAVVVALLIVGALAVISAPAVVPAVVVAFVIAAPAGNGGATALDGLRAFARHPLRSVLLALATLLGVMLLAVAAFAWGFFVTGALGAFATWVVTGSVGTVLVRAWARRAVRPPARP